MHVLKTIKKTYREILGSNSAGGMLRALETVAKEPIGGKEGFCRKAVGGSTGAANPLPPPHPPREGHLHMQGLSYCSVCFIWTVRFSFRCALKNWGKPPVLFWTPCLISKKSYKITNPEYENDVPKGRLTVPPDPPAFRQNIRPLGPAGRPGGRFRRKARGSGGPPGPLGKVIFIYVFSYRNV